MPILGSQIFTEDGTNFLNQLREAFPNLNNIMKESFGEEVANKFINAAPQPPAKPIPISGITAPQLAVPQPPQNLQKQPTPINQTGPAKVPVPVNTISPANPPAPNSGGLPPKATFTPGQGNLTGPGTFAGPGALPAPSFSSTIANASGIPAGITPALFANGVGAGGARI
jgi:hypothetical protein